MRTNNNSEFARKLWFEYRQTKLNNNSDSWELIENYPIDPPYSFLKYELGWALSEIKNYKPVLKTDCATRVQKTNELNLYSNNEVVGSWENTIKKIKETYEIP